YYAATLMTENFFIIGILWVLDLAGEWGQAGSSSPTIIRRGLLLGLALGMTVLLRQIFLLFIPFLFVWLLWRSYRDRAHPPNTGLVERTPSRNKGLATYLRINSVMRMAVILLMASVVLLLTVAPWTIRNYRAFNRFVLLNTNAGFAFYWSNHPIHDQNYPADLPDWEAYIRLIPPELLALDEAELDQVLLKRGF